MHLLPLKASAHGCHVIMTNGRCLWDSSRSQEDLKKGWRYSISWSLAPKECTSGQGSSACLVWGWEEPCSGARRGEAVCKNHNLILLSTLKVPLYSEDRSSQESCLGFLPQELLSALHLYLNISPARHLPHGQLKAWLLQSSLFSLASFLPPTEWFTWTYWCPILDIKIRFGSYSPSSYHGISLSSHPLLVPFCFTAERLKGVLSVLLPFGPLLSKIRVTRTLVLQFCDSPASW